MVATPYRLPTRLPVRRACKAPFAQPHPPDAAHRRAILTRGAATDSRPVSETEDWPAPALPSPSAFSRSVEVKSPNRQPRPHLRCECGRHPNRRPLGSGRSSREKPYSPTPRRAADSPFQRTPQECARHKRAAAAPAAHAPEPHLHSYVGSNCSTEWPACRQPSKPGRYSRTFS